jgi:hypothetical protein
MWVERQLTDTMGVRAGFVYKTEDDLITTNYQKDRPISVYTQPFTFVDIGLDGVRGTADDRNLTMFAIPPSVAAGLSTDQYVMNLPEFGRYKTFEASANKRYGNKWSATFGGGFTWQNNYPDNYPQTPNKYPDFQDAEHRTTWQFKVSGTYDAPFGFRLSPIMRHQSGVNFAREATITAPTGSGLVVSGGGPNATRIHVERADANREDNIWVFDTRVERPIKFGHNLQLRAFFDLFNMTNSHASETIGRATGLSYLKPVLILAPRTMRLGFRMMW